MARLSLVFILSAVLLGVTIVNAEEPIRIAITTGGHGYDREPFHAAFRSMEGIEFFVAEYPKAEELFQPEVRKNIDVFVFYDMNREIAESTKQNMLDMLKEGKGIVAIHHCIASYPEWKEYTNIIASRYFLNPETFQGKAWEKSTYKHDEWVDAKVAAKDHPVMKGLSDFRIYDEVYGNHWVSPDVTVLLTTEHPESQGALAWAHTCKNARVVYIQLGHGKESYANPNFQTLVRNAIQWVKK